MALQLLIGGRYRYYLTDGALYPGRLPSPELVQVFLRWIPTHPSSPIPEGQELHGPGIRHAHPDRQGKLAEIHRQNKLYDYYQDFLGEQVVGEQATALAVGPDAVIGPLVPPSVFGSERLGQPVAEAVRACSPSVDQIRSWRGSWQPLSRRGGYRLAMSPPSPPRSGRVPGCHPRAKALRGARNPAGGGPSIRSTSTGCSPRARSPAAPSTPSRGSSPPSAWCR